jgi:hypothetical protein
VAPRRDLVERSAPFLPPGSEIRQACIAQAAPSFILFIITYLTGLTMFWIKYRCVAITQDAIYVLESTKLSGGARPHSMVGTMPRRTQLGPASGRWAKSSCSGSATGFTNASTPRSQPPIAKSVSRPTSVREPIVRIRRRRASARRNTRIAGDAHISPASLASPPRAGSLPGERREGPVVSVGVCHGEIA